MTRAARVCLDCWDNKESQLFISLPSSPHWKPLVFPGNSPQNPSSGNPNLSLYLLLIPGPPWHPALTLSFEEILSQSLLLWQTLRSLQSSTAMPVGWVSNTRTRNGLVLYSAFTFGETEVQRTQNLPINQKVKSQSWLRFQGSSAVSGSRLSVSLRPK